jgi:uncharacterized membrane protein YjdF
VTAPATAWRLSARDYVLIALALIVLQVLVLYALGRVPFCTCGTIKLWQSTVNSSENSQHIFDWYTPSHVIHGVIFYFILWLMFPKTPVMLRLAMAIGIEVAWEIVENTPAVIERYRSGTISLSYYGDSIVNSVADTLAMTFGFLLAAKLPVAVCVAGVLAFELFTAYWIRDNLTLNVLMLLYPLDAIRDWQAALPQR